MVTHHEKQALPMSVLARIKRHQSIGIAVFPTWAAPDSIIVTSWREKDHSPMSVLAHRQRRPECLCRKFFYPGGH